MAGNKKAKRNKTGVKDTLFTQGESHSLISDYDFRIVLAVTALVIFGVIMVFSAGYYQTVSQETPDPYYYLKRQGFFALVGAVLMYICARIDYHFYKKLYIPILLEIGRAHV